MKISKKRAWQIVLFILAVAGILVANGQYDTAVKLFIGVLGWL